MKQTRLTSCYGVHPEVRPTVRRQRGAIGRRGGLGCRGGGCRRCSRRCGGRWLSGCAAS